MRRRVASDKPRAQREESERGTVGSEEQGDVQAFVRSSFAFVWGMAIVRRYGVISNAAPVNSNTN